MFEIIVAVDKNFGIGKKGKLPWSCKEEMQIFKNKTTNNVVIFGRKTFKSIPKLKNRTVFYLSRKEELSLEKILEHTEVKDKKKINYIAGGREIYSLVLESGLVSRIHISFIQDEYDCDTYFDKKWLNDFVVVEETKYDKFTHCVMEKEKNGETQYINILKDVFLNGVEKKGRNGMTISKFCKNLTFDLRNGFPLLTTKKMFLRGIVEELLFFLRGETNTKSLEDKGVNIWKGNTSIDFLNTINKINRKEGLMGPMYGYQWRHGGAKYCENTGKPLTSGIDQLEEIIKLIKHDPNSRRILMTTYNIHQVKEGVLYPCHSIILQFYVEDEYLDMYCYNRSSDLFLGLPFNIASSSLLLELVANITNKKARYFHLSLGDCHIYENHIKVVRKQIERIPYKFPNLVIKKKLEDINDIEYLKYEDFEVLQYKSHKKLSANMVA